MASNTYEVQISPRQSFDLWLFLFGRQGVQPKTREESRALRQVCHAFGIKGIKDRIDALAEGAQVDAREYSHETAITHVTDLDLNLLLGYLDDLQRAEAALSDRLLDVSDELERAKLRGTVDVRMLDAR